MPAPANPKIYHIVHIDNLRSIIADGCLWSDEIMTQKQGGQVIGMNTIKARRLTLPVSCRQGTRVGQYVPFYFCSRSIMLYVIHCANHPELAYRGGQGPIVHLEADLLKAVKWADDNAKAWAFSLSNAGANYAQFRDQLDQLDEIDWAAVAAADFRPPDVKEGKQAEFLVHGSFPWGLVERIGVMSSAIGQLAAQATTGAQHRPTIEIKRDWYY